MKKILIIGVSKECGGIETLFYSIFGIRQQNFNIDFLTFDDQCAFENEYKLLGYNVYHMEPRSSKPFSFNKKVKDFYKKHNCYDYIWFNTASTSMYQFQYYGRKMTKAKIITHSHGIKSEERSFVHAIINKLLAKVNRNKVMNNTDLFFACSSDAGFYLFGKKFAKNVEIINNGIDVDRYKYNEDERIKIRREFGIDNHTLLLGMVGRIAEVKNPIKSLDIMDKLRNYDVKLLFVGDGNMRNKVEKKVLEMNLSEKVVFAGFRKDVANIYSALDMLLMPSSYEGLGTTAIEAQTSGLKCLLSKNMPNESKITDLAEFLDISDMNLWREHIIAFNNSQKHDRVKYANIVLETDYNVEKTRNKIKALLV